MFKKIMLGFVSAIAASVCFADPATGWLQTAAGTYDFNDPANWVGGEINGVFGNDLAIEGAQTITVSADTVLTGGITIRQTGAFAITFSSDDTSTLTFNGDLVNESAGAVSFASGLKIDLGGAVRAISSVNALTLAGVIRNGGIVYRNTGVVTVSGVNDYGLGTWLKGSGKVSMGSDACFGAQGGALHLCAGSYINSNAKNSTRTIANGNNVYIEGDFQLGDASKDLGGVKFGAGNIYIMNPVTINVVRYTFAFGEVAADSPYGWESVSFYCNNSTLPATIAFTGFAGSVFTACNVTIGASDDTGTMELRNSKLTLNDSNKNPNATIKLRNNAVLTLKTTVGGNVSGMIGKVVCGGGQIAYSGLASTDTTYELNLELDNVSGTPTLTPTAANNAVTTLSAVQFSKGNGAMLNVGSVVLGTDVRFLVNGMAATDLIPWARTSTGEFAAYDADNGIVTLDTTGADFVTYDAAMTCSDLAGKHVTIPNGVTFTPDADVTVKSLNVKSTGSATTIAATDYAITISSGAMNVYGQGKVSIQSPIAFGSNHGYISFRNGYVQEINSGISGAAGLTFSDMSAGFNTGKDWKGLALNGVTTYAGDTYVNGVMYLMKNGCVPYGADRAGNLYVNGYLNFYKAVNYDFHANSLNGSGQIMKDNYTMSINVGEDGSSGCYDGTIADNKQFTFNKYGTGKQIMNGSIYQQYSINVYNGELELNDSVTVSAANQTITVHGNATSETGSVLSGAGTLNIKNGVEIKDGATLKPGSVLRPGKPMTLDSGTTLTFEEGSRIHFHVGSDYQGQLICSDAVAGAVDVALTFDWDLNKAGSWMLLEAPSIAPTFKVQNKPNGCTISVVKVMDDDGVSVLKEQLWVSRIKGFSVYVR